jgi:hypothetical protein
MTTLEIILTSAVGILTASNFLQFFSIKELKAKQQAEITDQQTDTEGKKDKILYDRIDFLDKRVTNLEKIACFNSDCKNRV